MRRHDFRIKKQPLVMIIPMIDIMLFLLVFFMISTIYMVQTNNFKVNLPQSSNANTQKETKYKVVPITVMSNGEILYDNDIISNKNLPQKIHQTLKVDKDTVFLLLGDKSTRYEQVVNVLELLKKSGIKHVSIATKTKN